MRWTLFHDFGPKMLIEMVISYFEHALKQSKSKPIIQNMQNVKCVPFAYVYLVCTNYDYNVEWAQLGTLAHNHAKPDMLWTLFMTLAQMRFFYCQFSIISNKLPNMVEHKLLLSVVKSVCAACSNLKDFVPQHGA